MVTSVQPGVRESSDFKLKPAAFRLEERVRRSPSSDHSRQAAFGRYLRDKVVPFQYSLVECRNRGKLCLRLIIQRSDFANILYCPIACYTERIN